MDFLILEDKPLSKNLFRDFIWVLYRPIHKKTEDENKGFEEHLDDIVGEMLALRKN